MTGARTTTSTTRHLSGGRKPKTPVEVTHERIAQDLETFRLAGGKIEGDGEPATPPPAPRRLHR